MERDTSVVLEPHDSTWHHQYETEGLQILESLDESYIEAIEHIGSTAVSGLVARPIIDIMIGLDDLESVSIHVVDMQQLGYNYLGEAGVEDRGLFRKRDTIDVDVSMVQYQGRHWSDHLLFRDYLREHPEVAERYGELKRGIVEERGIEDPLEYSKAKSDWIETTLERAREI